MDEAVAAEIQGADECVEAPSGAFWRPGASKATLILAAMEESRGRVAEGPFVGDEAGVPHALFMAANGGRCAAMGAEGVSRRAWGGLSTME